MYHAVYEVEGPVAVRYPRGGNDGYMDCNLEDLVLWEGTDATLVCYGAMVGEALRAANLLERQGISLEIVKLWQLAPLDLSKVSASVQKTRRLIVLEEDVRQGCLGQEILAGLAQENILPEQARLMNLGDGFVTHGAVAQLRKAWGIDAAAVCETVKELIGHEERKTGSDPSK